MKPKHALRLAEMAPERRQALRQGRDTIVEEIDALIAANAEFMETMTHTDITTPICFCKHNVKNGRNPYCPGDSLCCCRPDVLEGSLHPEEHMTCAHCGGVGHFEGAHF